MTQSNQAVPLPRVKRLVIDLAEPDHRAIKAFCADSGITISGFVRLAVGNELRRREGLLNRSPGSPDGPTPEKGKLCLVS